MPSDMLSSPLRPPTLVCGDIVQSCNDPHGVNAGGGDGTYAVPSISSIEARPLEYIQHATTCSP